MIQKDSLIMDMTMESVCEKYDNLDVPEWLEFAIRDQRREPDGSGLLWDGIIQDGNKMDPGGGTKEHDLMDGIKTEIVMGGEQDRHIFEDLDIIHKEDNASMTSSASPASSSSSPNEDEEPFSFLNDLELQSLESGRAEDVCKADLMWSSTLTFLDKNDRRKRNVSLTLSECAESLFKDLDILGPSSKCLDHIDTPLPSETDEEATDEEIDVVSDDGQEASNSSSTPTSTHNASSGGFGSRNKHSSSSSYHQIQAGRSLLRKHHYPQQQQQQQQHPHNKQQQQQQPKAQPLNVIDHSLGDHCYFLTERPEETNAYGNGGGILTPNETSSSSSDDDEGFRRKKFQRSSGSNNTTSTAGNGNSKRRIHHRSGSRGNSCENVKFKFRMKFKSNSPQRSSHHHQGNGSSSSNGRGLKRKSAIRNTHCPAPSPTKVPKLSPSASVASSSVKRKNKFEGSSDEKCREIRDLHNSMERQRRVDLRNNFDQLKEVVPELADVDKASKLNILNKSADYCRLLASMEAKLRREKERENQRTLMLKKRLAGLAASFGGESSSNRSLLSNSSRHYWTSRA